MERRRATLETVARALGVSKMTVSNAYNRPDQLSPALRERVLGMARELGYPGPNPVASVLRRGRSGTLGVAFDDSLSYAFTDPAAVLFMQGISSECERAGVGLLLVPGSPRASNALEVIRNALVDSFAVFSDHEGDERIEVLRERGLPFVLVDSPRVPGAPSVHVDDRGGARMAAQHLLDLGHRRFGIVAFCISPDSREGPLDPNWERLPGYFVTKQRLLGYRDALEGAGIDWEDVTVYQQNGVDLMDTHESADDTGHRLMARLLDRAERPTAILAMSDELALGAFRAATDRGISVPRELSIVGFDDVPDAARAQPALTTVRQPLAEKGAVAARLLLADELDVNVEVELPIWLMVRASTAPAPTL